jgi:CHASE2 domain-containing sensor protein
MLAGISGLSLVATSLASLTLSRLFISHSKKDNLLAKAFKQWLGANGWAEGDVFLDLDDIGAGERWKEALRKANARCEAVILLASPDALASPECLAEVRKAEDFGKEIIVALMRDLQMDDSRLDSLRERQIVDLAEQPQTHIETVIDRGQHREVRFNAHALARVKDFLFNHGIQPDCFAWPPLDRKNAEPFPGLSAFTESDAGIFFGRDADILRGLDRLRVLQRNGRPRVLVIQAASGAGKSSYLRAGLWPRLGRDPDYAPLAILRPAKGILTGPEGLGRKLAVRLSRPGAEISPGDIHAKLMARDESKAVARFRRLMAMAAVQAHEQRRLSDHGSLPPVLLLAIDQAEELFSSEEAAESRRFLLLLGNLMQEPPAGTNPLAIMTIRTDRAARLFQAIADQKMEVPDTFPLLPLPQTSYRDVILKPLEVAARRGQRLAIDATLADRLVADATGADALPLLAFTLSYLYQEYSLGSRITLAHYETMGGIAGSIDLALKRALARPRDMPAIPAARDEQFALLRAAFIPWLARIDVETNLPRRRVVKLDEFPQHTRAMVERLIEARLLVADRRSGADIVEVAHESLLRQWPALAAWLQADAEDLKRVEAVERAAAEWVRNGRQEAWLDHRAERLRAAERAATRDDFRNRLGEDGLAYLNACGISGRRRIGIFRSIAFFFPTILLLAAMLWRAIDASTVSELREGIFDTYQRLQPRRDGGFPLTIADIDEKSLKDLGSWPWPRKRLATLVQRLHDFGATVIAFDVVFAEPSRPLIEAKDFADDQNMPLIEGLLARMPDQDKMFAETLQQSPTVLGFSLSTLSNDWRPTIKAVVNEDDAGSHYFWRFSGSVSNIPMLENAAKGVGAINLPRGETVRHLYMVMSDHNKVYPSIVVETLRVAQSQRSILLRRTGASNAASIDLHIGSVRVPLNSDGSMRLYYRRHNGQLYMSASDILSKEMEDVVRPRIKGQIVLVGTSAVGLFDSQMSPFGVVPGVSIFAQAIEQILGQTFLTRPDWAYGIELLATFLFSFLLGVLALAFGLKFALLIGVPVGALMVGGCWLAFIRFGLLLDPIYPVFAALCIGLCVGAMLFFATDDEKEIIRQGLKTYIADILKMGRT